MESWGSRMTGNWLVFVLGFIYFLAGFAAASVVVIGKNVSLSFDDVEANFAPPIKGSGECGALYVAEPLDACTDLTNKVANGSNPPFALIIRGGCTFVEKVQNAQTAGFKAAIVYDNEDSGVLVAMAGTSVGIHIHAVFVSKAAGEILKKYAGHTEMEFWITPTFENSAWSIMAISFISLLAMSAVLATCFFIRRNRIRQEQPRASVREFHGMSSRLVKAMPSLVFSSVSEDNCTSTTCAICLEDYSVGDKLRILPCQHKFHALCVDSWLTAWRSFCPVCKQDAGTNISIPPASESTPLLSSVAASPSSSAGLSSFHSSGSPAIPIIPPLRPPLSSQTHSHAGSFAPNSHRSFNNSPSVGINRSSLDPRQASSQRSHHSYLVSPHSIGFSLSPSINSRYATPYIPSSDNPSPSYLVGTSGRLSSFLWHCNESDSSLSALASAQSLPGC